MDQKPWANPTPAGLVALAVACFCFFAMLTGRVDHAAQPLLGCWLLGGFVIQILVAILDLKSGNTSGGNTFMYFSAFFMLVGGIENLYKFKCATEGITLDARIDGYAWLVLSLIVILWTPAFFKSPLPLTLAIFALDVACPVVAFTDMGVLDKAYAPIAGWALLFAGIFGIYLASALVLNATFGKQVLPTFGSIIKA